MFVFKGLKDALSDMVFGRDGSGPGGSLMQLPSGQLYYRNPMDPKASRSLVYKDATATIVRAHRSSSKLNDSKSNEFQYQLVVSRVYEEGERELEEDDDFDDQQVFLLDVLLKPRRELTAIDDGEEEARPCFIWFDVAHVSGVCSWEFVVDSSVTNQTTIDAFEEILYRCMFERKYQKPHNQVTKKELEAFVKGLKAMTSGSLSQDIMTSKFTSSLQSTPLKSPSQMNSNLVHSDSNETLIAMSVGPTAPGTPSVMPMSTGPTVPSTPGAFPTSNSDISKDYLASDTTGPTMGSVEAELYLYDLRFHQFVRQAESVLVSLARVNGAPFQFTFMVSQLNRPLISQLVDPRMTPTFNKEHRSFVWNWFNEDTGEGPYSWSVKFTCSPDSEADFKRLFSKCIYEALNEETFDTVKKADQDWISAAYEDDVEMDDAFANEEEEEEEEEEIIAPRGALRSKSAGLTSAESDSDEEDENASYKDNEQNTNLTVGYKYDRSYVLRGNKIGVFNTADDDQLKFQTMITPIKTLKGDNFTPSKVMLHEQDSAMLMMHPGDDKTVFKMDLETGKVVEEWKVDDDLPVSEILPDAKYAQMTPQKTLIGINRNSIFRIDPRLAGNKRVADESKQYATKADFSCAVTTGKGELAVASKKGDIRLYNKLNIRAKTHLPGLGDPILGIDTTENGKFVLATCKTYLLVLSTEMKQTDQTGFSKSMGDQKPVPKRLQLKPEHVAWMGEPVNFTVAKFSTGQDEEKTIITSTGPYVITWNFRRVKAGRLYDYTIKKYTQNVVADNFKFGQDRSIIVALPTDVQMVHKSNLQTPKKLLKSRSSIVNSPY